MAAENYRKRLRDEGTCTVCLDFFKDPVTLDCGHNFCRACLTRSWEERPADTTCPQCSEREPAPRRLRTNQQLANFVQIAKELSELQVQESAGGAICERPQEQGPETSGQQPSTSKDGSSTEESVQDKICHFLEILNDEEINNLLYTRVNKNQSQDLLRRLQAERGKVAAAFSQLPQFLEKQEKLWQAPMEEVEKEIVRRRDEHQASLSAELSSLESLIQELEEKQQLPADELPQNLGDLLERCERESFENPEVFPESLKGRIRDLSNPNSSVEGITKRFQDFLVLQLLFQKANVTLDPNTACPELFLSQDGKFVSWERAVDEPPANPEAFDELSAVLGREGFTSGRHFWEVAVGDVEEWYVGVARKSVERKTESFLEHESGVWAFRLWEEEYRVSTEDTPLSLSQPLKKIRVTLNYEDGQVGFFNADTEDHLYTYSGAEFRGETVLPYFCVVCEGSLTVLP